MKQELKILQAIRKGWKTHGTNGTPAHDAMTAEFFRQNDRKLDVLVEATMHDMEVAETAVLRKANDDYRKAIFNAQVYANSGAGTYEKAVDMATKDMLSRGLNCVMYANGARHTLQFGRPASGHTCRARARNGRSGALPLLSWQSVGIRALSAFPLSARCLLMMCGAAAVRMVWIQRPENAIRL